MLKDFIYEALSYGEDCKPIRRLKYMYSIRLLLEMQRFTIEGNFDHISSSIVAMYVYLADSFKVRKEVSKDANNENRLANRLNRR